MIAKFIITFTINIILSVYIVMLGFLFGWVIGLPQWSPEIFVNGLNVLTVVTILTTVLSTPVAFFASYGRGYLAPLGFVFLTLVFSQIITAAGFGEYFPWAIPAIYSGIAGDGATLEWNSLCLILITCLFGIFSTLYWWLFTDHH